jgi:hypothetical protein
MFFLNDNNRFFLYPHPTDMRKSFYSLSGIVTNTVELQVQDGDAFVFINRSLTGMKILHAEYCGLVIYHMKLEKGAIKLPEIDLGNGATSQDIQWSELIMMVQGISIQDTKRKARWELEK